MLIECTKKLLDQLNIKPSSSAGEEPLFSWHANLLTLNRKKAVVLVNDSNRYVIVLYGLKAGDFKKLDGLIIKAIRETLSDECIRDEVIEQFINQSGNIVYGKTKDKTSVARMNKSCEVVSYYEDLLNADSIFQNSLSISASRYLMGNGKNNYITPSEELYKDLEAFYGKPIFSSKAAVFKITLDLEAHTVWRRIAVPLNITFDRFHKVIQAAFGWEDYHLHEFFIYENVPSDNEYSSDDYINHPAYNKGGFKPIINLVCGDDAFDYPDEGDITMRLETGVKLSEYIPEHKRIKYNYDFGDNWQHYIEVERVIDDYDKNYCICLEGEGNTPPEDVGGEGGYEEFLRVMSDEKDPEYDDMLNWSQSQGFRDFDIDDVNRMLKYI